MRSITVSLESDLSALLKTLCPRVFPDLAPINTTLPYVTWQALGGESARFLDGTAADKRNVYLQVNVWAKTRLESLALIRAIEDALCMSATLTARPEGEAISTYESDTLLYGSLQRYSVWAAR